MVVPPAGGGSGVLSSSVAAARGQPGMPGSVDIRGCEGSVGIQPPLAGSWASWWLEGHRENVR